MKDAFIYGCGNYARIIYQYMLDDVENNISFFVQSDELKDRDFFWGKDVLAFSSLDTCDKCLYFYIGVMYDDLNMTRALLYEKVLKRGFRPLSFIHHSAEVASSARLGEHVTFFERTVVQHGTSIGNNTILYAGSVIAHDSQVSDHCFIAQNVSVCGGVNIGSHSFVGAGAIIHNGITIGKGCLIGAGASVAHDIPDDTAVCAPHSQLRSDAYKFFLRWNAKKVS